MSLQQRRILIRVAKWMLPAGAALLLAALALWPELTRQADRERLALKAMTSNASGDAVMDAPRYRGVDERSRPYTVTAQSGRQMGPDRIGLAQPKGDMLLEGGSWVMVQARNGLYRQRQSQLDLSGDATLYRGDGTTMVSDSASVDVKSGAAASADRTHAEGPFGTLDAQGYTLLDKGDVVQFPGPGRAVLNAAQARP